MKPNFDMFSMHQASALNDFQTGGFGVNQALESDDEGWLARVLLQPPLCINPLYVDVTGSLPSAVYLSHIMTEYERCIFTSGVIDDVAAIKAATKLSPAEQKNAKTKLQTLGILLIKKQAGQKHLLQIQDDALDKRTFEAAMKQVNLLKVQSQNNRKAGFMQ